MGAPLWRQAWQSRFAHGDLDLEGLPCDEAALFGFLDAVAWPDPSPELEGLSEKVDLAVELLSREPVRAGVAKQAAFYKLVSQFQRARRRWKKEGGRLALPAGAYEHQLDSYAVLRGKAEYESALASLEGANALAAREGFSAHCQALVNLEDAFSQWFSALPDAELLAFIGEIAVREPRAGEELSGRFVHHPEFGYGLVKQVSGDGLVVTFDEEERELIGAAAQWDDPDSVFRRDAYARAHRPPMKEEAFWQVVAALEWARDNSVERAGRVLADRLDLEEALSFAATRMELLGRLSARIEAWEEATGGRVEAGDDRLRDLVNHVIGVGRDEYERTLAEPHLAAERALRRDFKESFAYVEQAAWELRSIDEIRRVLGLR
ncbi:MAG: DUF4240 domain-containing protein [Polyangiaceae bacterium]